MKKTEAVIKTDLASNWAKAVNYIPDKGVIVIYEYENNTPRIKLGNGIDKVNDLPFLINPPRINQGILEL